MNKTSKNFQPLDTRGTMRLLQFAMLGISKEIRTIQENIVLQERFKDDAVLYPDMHNPNRPVADYKVEESKRSLADLVLFAKNTQSMLDHVKDADLNNFVSGVKDYFNTKK